MSELIKILEYNNIKYKNGIYGYDRPSIIITGNKYSIEIFEDESGLVRDLRKIPYTWGAMGSTSLDYIFYELKEHLNIDIKNKNYQLNLFDF